MIVQSIDPYEGLQWAQTPGGLFGKLQPHFAHSGDPDGMEVFFPPLRNLALMLSQMDVEVSLYFRSQCLAQANSVARIASPSGTKMIGPGPGRKPMAKPKRQIVRPMMKMTTRFAFLYKDKTQARAQKRSSQRPIGCSADLSWSCRCRQTSRR